MSCSLELPSRRVVHPFEPSHLMFIVTNHCNLDCQYCYNRYKKSSQYLEPELGVFFVRDYLRYQEQNGIEPEIRMFSFTGGEPSLNSGAIFKIVDFINSQRKLSVFTLLTSGVMSDKLLDRFIENKFIFQISYDGIRNLLRTTLKGKNVHEKVIRAIRRVANSKLPVTIKATVTLENVCEMEKIIDFAAENEVESIIITPVSLDGNAKINCTKRASIDLYVENFFMALMRAKKLGINFYSVEQNRFVNNGKHQEIAPTVVLPDGYTALTSMYSSSRMQGASRVLTGRYTREKGLEVYEDYLKTIEKNFVKNVKKHCSGCSSFNYCRGRNTNYIPFALKQEVEANDIDFYFCELTRGLYKNFEKTIASENLVATS